MLSVVPEDVVAWYRNVSLKEGAAITDVLLARLRGKHGLRNIRKG